VSGALPVVRHETRPMSASQRLPAESAPVGIHAEGLSRMRRIMIIGSSNWINAMAVLDTLNDELSWSPFGLGVICGNDRNVDQIIRQWVDRAQASGRNVAVLSGHSGSGGAEERNRQMISWNPDVCHVFALPDSTWNWDLSTRCLERGIQVVGHGSEGRAQIQRYRTGARAVAEAINASAPQRELG